MSDGTPSGEESGVDTVEEELGLDLPDEPAAAAEVLAAELVRTRRDAQSHLDDLKRVAADFENYRKRAQREYAEMVGRAAQRIISDLLPVLDSLDAAAGGEAETPGEEALLAGLRGTRQQLADVLAAEGLEPIEALGKPFDPNVHEAISGGGDGHLVVVAELRRGYTLNGRVLRPALVEVVAEDLSPEEAPDDHAPKEEPPR